MDYLALIDKYYADNEPLKEILLTHSRMVADRCLRIAQAHPKLNLDTAFLEEAAMLHDIGIFLTNAPGISCFGTHPYICHGYLGAELMRREGFPKHARVCERHTGTGLTLQNILEQNLPLPHQDFVPETLEEQVVCYADKFYSKTHPDRERSYERSVQSLQKFGEAGVEKFVRWHKMFA